YHPNEKNETDRQAVNQWVRTHFDGVIDFDKVVRDPAHPEMMLPEFDSGDHLHPGPAGFAAMAEAIPVSLFVNCGKTIGTSQSEFRLIVSGLWKFRLALRGRVKN